MSWILSLCIKPLVNWALYSLDLILLLPIAHPTTQKNILAFLDKTWIFSFINFSFGSQEEFGTIAKNVDNEENLSTVN